MESDGRVNSAGAAIAQPGCSKRTVLPNIHCGNAEAGFRCPLYRPAGTASRPGGQLSSNSPPKFLLAISTETMVRMSTLVVLLRTSDRKLAFYAAIALKATELIIML